MSYGLAQFNERRRKGAERPLPHGFSLIELVIVVVIIGIIAAIAIPRMSRGSKGASESALAGNLSVLRNAIDMFSSEHDGVLPTTATFEAQMTGYTKIDGSDAQPTKDTGAGRIYGPYLRQLPPQPIGSFKGKSGVDSASGATIGWIYTESTGDVRANVSPTLQDTAGNYYKDY